jgi:hypothetical protein
LQNNNKDSALYYANQAVKTAPNWPCALTTLALIQRSQPSQPDEPKKVVKKPGPYRKTSFGFTVGGGPKPIGSCLFREIQIPASLVLLQTQLLHLILALFTRSISAGISLYDPRSQQVLKTQGLILKAGLLRGGPIITEPVDVRGTAVKVTLPLLIRFSSKKYCSLYFFRCFLQLPAQSKQRFSWKITDQKIIIYR